MISRLFFFVITVSYFFSKSDSPVSQISKVRRNISQTENVRAHVSRRKRVGDVGLGLLMDSSEKLYLADPVLDSRILYFYYYNYYY